MGGRRGTARGVEGTALGSARSPALPRRRTESNLIVSCVSQRSPFLPDFLSTSRSFSRQRCGEHLLYTNPRSVVSARGAAITRHSSFCSPELRAVGQWVIKTAETERAREGGSA